MNDRTRSPATGRGWYLALLLPALLAACGGKGSGGPLPSHVERKLRLAKDQLREIEDALAGKSRRSARAADAFVHENPWQTLGAGAGLGLVIGLALGVFFNHRADR